jgi:hypothetical protein
MNRLVERPVICLAAILLAAGAAAAKEKPQTAWALVIQGPAEVHSKASRGSKVLAHLNAGALLAASDTKQSRGEGWTRVRVVSLGTLEAATGWAESSRLESLPLNQYPTDTEIENLLGGPYLEDVNAKYTQVARYLVNIGHQQPALACYIGSLFIPQTRLQFFERTGVKWTAGPHLEFMPSQAKTGVTDIEIRDLVGDGNECLITHEPFDQTFGARGENLVIRRLEGGEFRTLWQAPVQVRNFSSFPAKINVLNPPERNIGAPGTIATGTVDYKASGKVSEPVWKGKVEFYVPGREAPVNTIQVEKVCKWNGDEFVPLN